MNEEELLEIYNNFYQYYSHEDFIKMLTNKERLQRKFRDTNKGLIKVLKSRNVWKNRYYKERQKRKNLIKYLGEKIRENQILVCDTEKREVQDIYLAKVESFGIVLDRIKGNNYEDTKD